MKNSAFEFYSKMIHNEITILYTINFPQQTLNQGMIWIMEYYIYIQLYCHKIHPCNLLIYCFQNFYQKNLIKVSQEDYFFISIPSEIFSQAFGICQ